jgi:hypothetical protein
MEFTNDAKQRMNQVESFILFTGTGTGTFNGHCTSHRAASEGN